MVNRDLRVPRRVTYVGDIRYESAFSIDENRNHYGLNNNSKICERHLLSFLVARAEKLAY